MKKKIILLWVLTLLATMFTSAYAVEEMFYEEYSVPAKGNVEKTFDGYDFTQNTVVEIDYDFTETDWAAWNDTACNIPFILKSNQQEIGRYSIMDKNKQLLGGRVEFFDASGKKDYQLHTSAVAKKGKIQYLVDFTNKEITVKYFGAEFKEEALLYRFPFSRDSQGKELDASMGLTSVQIGASGCPGGNIKLKVFSVADFGAYQISRSKYNFETEAYQTGIDTEILDFRTANSNVSIKNDPVNVNNKALFLPKTTPLQLTVLPINQGYTGKLYVKYRFYIAGDNDVAAANGFQCYEYKTGQTTEVTNLLATNNYALSLRGNDKTQEPVDITGKDIMLNRWNDVVIVYDMDAHTASLYADHIKAAGDIQISDTISFLNRFKIQFNENDVYIDDFEIGNLAEGQIMSAVNIRKAENKYAADFKLADISSVTSNRVLLILAAYDKDNKLLENGISIKTDVFPNINEELVLEDLLQDAAVIRAFVWDIDTLTPIIPSEKLIVE